MSTARTAPPGTALEATRMVAALTWVAATSAITLGALGALPGWLAPESHEVRPVASLEEAQRWVGAPLASPSYFPSRLGWPPVQVRVAGGRGGAVAVTFRARPGQGADLELLQATAPGVPIPAALLGVSRELSATRTTVGARPARLVRVLVDGATWDEVRWERDGLAMVLRTQGGVDELLRMARSAHRQGGAR